MLADYIKSQIALTDRAELERRVNFLCKLPENTFQAIYDNCFSAEPISGTRYNGTYYSEWEIYFASHDRDSDAEVLV